MHLFARKTQFSSYLLRRHHRTQNWLFKLALMPALHRATLSLPAIGATMMATVLTTAPCIVHADTAREHFDLAIKHYKANKLDDALAEFQKAHDLSPKEPTSLFWIGFLYLQQRRYQDALKPTLDALALRPNFADGHLNLGNIYDGLKKYPEAIAEFENAIKLEPNMPRLADAYYNLGSVHLKMGHKAEALTSFQKAASIASDDPYVQDQLGYAYQMTGVYEKAVLAHQNATRLAATNGNFWLNLGLAQQGLARKQAGKGVSNTAALAAARDAFTHALKLAPEDYAVRETYGEVLYESRAYDEAIVQFKKAAQLNPKDYAPAFNMALAYTQLKNYQAAADAYTSVTEIDPNNLAAQQGKLNCLGTLYYQRAQFGEAAQNFQKLTQLKPENAVAWSNYSLALQKQGKADEATAALEEAIKHVGQGKESIPLRLELANSYYRKDTADSIKLAGDLYQQVAQAAPTNADACNGLGLIAQKLRKYDDAIAAFKKATLLNPRFDDAYNNLGIAYESKGDTAQAIANCKKALQINPNNKLAKDNLARLTKTGTGK